MLTYEKNGKTFGILDFDITDLHKAAQAECKAKHFVCVVEGTGDNTISFTPTFDVIGSNETVVVTVQCLDYTKAHGAALQLLNATMTTSQNHKICGSSMFTISADDDVSQTNASFGRLGLTGSTDKLQKQEDGSYKFGFITKKINDVPNNVTFAKDVKYVVTCEKVPADESTE